MKRWPPTSPPCRTYRQDLAGSHNNLGILLAGPGEAAGGGAAVPQGPDHPREAGRRLPRRAGLPPGAGQQPQQPGDSAGRTWGSGRRRSSSTARPWPSKRSWPPTSPPCRSTARIWPRSHNNLGNLLADLGKRPEAEQQYRKALAIQEKLAADFPAVPEYRQDLASKPQQPGASAGRPGEAAGGGAAVPQGPDHSGKAGRRLPRRAGVPPGSGPKPQQPGDSAGWPGEAAGGGAAVPQGPGRSKRSWPPTSPPCRSTARSWPEATTTWGFCWPAWASGRRRSSSTARP